MAVGQVISAYALTNKWGYYYRVASMANRLTGRINRESE